MIHQRRTDNRIPAPLVEALTPREKQVLQLLAQGLSNKAIADKLILGPCTIKTHLHNIYRKLKVRNRTSAAIFAFRCGIVEKL